MPNVKVTISSIQTVTARLDESLLPGQHAHQQPGDWLIQVIDPKSTNQTVLQEHRGASKNAQFDLEPDEIYNIRAARLDTNGNVIGAIMIMGYKVGYGSLPAIDIPGSISVEE